MKAAVDNDVLLKGARYGLLDNVLQAIPCNQEQVGILGAAPFVLRSLLKRLCPAAGSEVGASLERVFALAHMLEPTPEELQFAAEMEFRAQADGLSLDAGESVLCAVALRRGSALVSGDKRAIVAMERLLGELEALDALSGKVICLELLFLRLMTREDPVAIRRAVCSDPGADRALSNCFSCSGGEGDPAGWNEGLTSYIAALRREARTILAD